MLGTLRAVKGFSWIMNQWTSKNPFTQHIRILTLFSPPSFVRKSKEEVNVEKGKSYENKMDQFRFLGNCSPMPSLSQLWVGGFP